MKAQLSRMSSEIGSLRATESRERSYIEKLESVIDEKQQAICLLESSLESYTEQLAALQQEIDDEKNLLEQSRTNLQEKTILADRQIEEKNYEKFASIIGQYDNLTVGLLCYLVLQDMGLSNEEMQAVLNVKSSSVRMRLKRLKDRKKK